MKSLILSALLANAAAAGGDVKNVLALPTSWRAEGGAATSLEALKGRWYALSFIYTSCAGSCPLTTKKLKRLDDTLAQAGKPLELVVVSLDPTHDTPAELVKYRDRYALKDAARWRILVGDDAQVRTLTMLLEFKYTKNPESGVIAHDNTVFLVNPKGDVVTSMSSLDQPMEAFVAAVPTPKPSAPRKGTGTKAR